MTVREFSEIYLTERKMFLEENTMLHKEQIVRNHINPILGDKLIGEVSAADILHWQMECLNATMKGGKKYSQSYLWTMNRELNAMFNHAEVYYDLIPNPVKKVRKMGRDKGGKIDFWTPEEYYAVEEYAAASPYYEAIEILYWCGLRIGEMLALTPDDIDLERREISVTKAIKRSKNGTKVGGPKTETSNRTVIMPDFLADDLAVYIKRHRKLGENNRLFPWCFVTIERALDDFAQQAGVKNIRVHDLRHSYVSLLINEGFTAFDIAQAVGHAAPYITYRYAHMFDSGKKKMAKRLTEIGSNRPFAR